MENLLSKLNENSGLVALFGVVLGWGLNTVTDQIKYKRQQKDELKRELRERFKNKAEFVVSENVDARSVVGEISFVMTSYKASLDDNGNVVTTLPKNITNAKKLRQKTLYLENIGKSDINELEIAAASPKHTALIDKEFIKEYTKNNYINYGMIFDRKIRQGDTVILKIYYLEKDPILNVFSASLEVYYRDSLNNICAQPLFPEQDKIYEPRAIEYSEWNEHVSVDKNLWHWQRRLEEGSNNINTKAPSSRN